MENTWGPINVDTIHYQVEHSPIYKWKYQLTEKSAKSTEQIPTNSSFQKEVFSR